MSRVTEPFERIPENFRLELWNCEREELPTVIQGINVWFKEHDQLALSFKELVDIGEGRWACDNALGRESKGFVICDSPYGAVERR